MTDADRKDVALAILLWKGYRLDLTGSGGVPTEASEQASYRSIELAKAAGVKDEFLELLFAHPTIEVFCKDLDKPLRYGRHGKGKGKHWAGGEGKRSNWVKRRG